uniref:translation initiation factor IF-2-like n=1 Tax=Nyctereutes procyonoides TaxID=34880 RepID=UPI00244428F2|nr:translation initiation factor IF-2-like [Nyctereutes procyonoides]
MLAWPGELQRPAQDRSAPRAPGGRCGARRALHQTRAARSSRKGRFLAGRGGGARGGPLGLHPPDPPGKRTPGDFHERAGLQRHQLQHPPPAPPDLSRPSPERAGTRTRPRTRPPPCRLTPAAEVAPGPAYTPAALQPGARHAQGARGGGGGQRRAAAAPAGGSRAPALLPVTPPAARRPGRVQHRPPPRATHPGSCLLQPKPPHKAWPSSSQPNCREGDPAGGVRRGSGARRVRGATRAHAGPAHGPDGRPGRMAGGSGGSGGPEPSSHRVPVGSAARSRRRRRPLRADGEKAPPGLRAAPATG